MTSSMFAVYCHHIFQLLSFFVVFYLEFRGYAVWFFFLSLGKWSDLNTRFIYYCIFHVFKGFLCNLFLKLNYWESIVQRPRFKSSFDQNILKLFINVVFELFLKFLIFEHTVWKQLIFLKHLLDVFRNEERIHIIVFGVSGNEVE